jgi:hypothetical protein
MERMKVARIRVVDMLVGVKMEMMKVARVRVVAVLAGGEDGEDEGG